MTCSLCTEILGGEPPLDCASRLFDIDDKWLLAPTLGPVSAMHVLLIPKRHVTFALTEVGASHVVARAHEIAQAAHPRERVIAFEHANSPTGCGVLHAHVHIAIVADAFKRDAIFGDTPAETVTSLHGLARTERELLWVRDRGELRASIDCRIASQTARRAVARANAITFSDDWKAYTHLPWFESSRRAAEQIARALCGEAPQRPARATTERWSSGA
jgi:diadenosine tetraphosphate (Ap4A) HIT family hydrolase